MSMIYVYVDYYLMIEPLTNKIKIEYDLLSKLTIKFVSIILFLLLTDDDDSKLSIINAADRVDMTVIIVLYCSSNVRSME